MSIYQIFCFVIIAGIVSYAKYAVGYTALQFFSKENQTFENQLIVGWTTITSILYFIVRHSLQDKLFLLVLAIILTSLLILIIKSLMHMNLSGGASYSICIVLSVTAYLMIDLAPFVLNKQIFFQNWGPDLDGNLITAAYMHNNFSFGELIHSYEKILDQNYWWNSERPAPWGLADTSKGIAVEFFLRSNRYAHAIEMSFISQIFKIPLWLSLKSLMLSSGILSSILIFQFCKKQNFNNYLAIIIPLIFAFGQTTLLMYYEGINVQLMFMPAFLFITFNAERILRPKLSELMPFALAFVLLMISYGEGAQVLAVWILIYALFNLPTISNKTTLNIYCVTILLTFFIFFTPICDFFFWSILRLQDSFIGGALHYNFFIPNVLLPIPYMTITEIQGHDAIELFVNSRHRYNLIFTILLFLSLYFWNIDQKQKIAVASFLITLIFVILSTHRYAIWKVCTIFAPLITVLLLSSFLNRFKNSASLLCTLLLMVNIFVAAHTALSYSKLTKPYYASQFQVNNYPEEECFGFITPSDNYPYIRLAYHGQLHWLNEAHRQYGFRLDPDQMLDIGQCSIYAYFDCTIEEPKICSSSKANLGDTNTFLKLPVELESLTATDGFLDKQKILSLRSKTFGLNRFD